jgi:hypothetical protein
VVAVFLVSSTTPIMAADFWGHLKVGEIIFDQGKIPAVDTFSFLTQGQPYIYQAWLAELFMYVLYRLGDLQLVVFFNTLLLTTQFALVLYMCWEASGNIRLASACTLLAAFFALAERDVRPQTFSFLLFTVFYLLVRCHVRNRRGPIVILPLLMALWANLHGGFLLGLAILGLAFLCESVKLALTAPGQWECLGGSPTALGGSRWGSVPLLGGVLAGCLVALLLNPLGPGVITYLTKIQGNVIIQGFVTEWFPASLRRIEDLPFFLAFFLCLALFSQSRRRLAVLDLVLFCFFALMAFQAVRNFMWFAVIMAPILTEQATFLLADLRTANWSESFLGKFFTSKIASKSTAASGERVGLNYLMAALFLVALFLGSPWVKTSLPIPISRSALIDPETPVGAVDFLEANSVQGRIFNPDIYGGYLDWRLNPRLLVFVDGRVELYPKEVWADYLLVLNGCNWEQVMAKYGIEYIFLSKKEHRALIAAISRSSSWQTIYSDQISVIFQRQEGARSRLQGAGSR